MKKTGHKSIAIVMVFCKFCGIVRVRLCGSFLKAAYTIQSLSFEKIDYDVNYDLFIFASLGDGRGFVTKS